jgi:hypothetical protein
MKKFLVSLVLFVSVFGISVQAAGDDKINPRAKEAFDKEFSGATYVKWEVLGKEGIYHAYFIHNNERLNAFYDEEGHLIATGRFIAESTLPLLVSKTIRARYDQYELRHVVEYINGNETSYLVTLENEKAKLVVQAYHSGSTYVFKKEKKNSLARL